MRRYEATPLDSAALEAVRGIADSVIGLSKDVKVSWQLRTCTPTDNLPNLVGGYGRLLTPPHMLVPAAVEFRDERAALVELGFQAEQVAVRLAALGLGSCFVGALPRDVAVHTSLGLPAGSLVAAILALGRPSNALGGRAINGLMRVATGATNKLPASKVHYNGDFASPGAPPASLAPLVEAARNAPSARDVQPWRTLGRSGDLLVFVQREPPGYGSGRSSLYRYHDGGACLANVVLAAVALGLGGTGRLLDPTAPDLQTYPAELEPIAIFGPLAS